MEFTLTIRLGNDAMRTGSDIAEALAEVAGKVESADVRAPTTGDTIHDGNGNTVGAWQVVEV